MAKTRRRFGSAFKSKVALAACRAANACIGRATFHSVKLLPNHLASPQLRLRSHPQRGPISRELRCSSTRHLPLEPARPGVGTSPQPALLLHRPNGHYAFKSHAQDPPSKREESIPKMRTPQIRCCNY
jgi:hypothetical protein